MDLKKSNLDKLTNDLIYIILEYNDDYTVKRIKSRIIIYEPRYKLILKCIDRICSTTDKNSVKSWRFFNHVCMKKLYKKCSYHDFHLLLQELTLKQIDLFIDIETVNMLHHLSISYYRILNYIYVTNYPIIPKEDTRLVYGLFWDYCKFYFMIDKGFEPREHTFLL